MFAENQRGELVESPISGSLTKGGGKPGQGYAAVRIGHGVRRLTPTECERLMGWPDDWTVIEEPRDGKHPPDGPRYAACGDGVVKPVAEWIGRRLIQHLQGGTDASDTPQEDT
jgi:DNA (cytosine-5)-methyltransferase 1